MRPRPLPWWRLALATLLCLCALPAPARSQSAATPAPAPASVEGFNCSANTTYPCQAYALYRAGVAGVPLDLSAVGDLIGVSRFMIAHANNLSTSVVPAAGQPLLVPLQCGCPSRSPNAYAPTQYQINSGDTFWIISTSKLQNLTQYQAVERVNPTLVPTKLNVGDMVTFPIFCQCPTPADNATALVTYVIQPGDTYASIATAFAVDAQSLVSLNGPERGTQLFSEILVPLRQQVPQWLPPIVRRNNVSVTSPPPSATPSPNIVTNDRNGVVTGLAVGLGVVGGLWLLQMLLLVCLWRRLKAKGRRGEAVVSGDGGEAGRFAKNASGGVGGGGERFLVSDISEWLDKYRVFKVEELERGTGGFDDAHLIQGSVYKANIDGEVFAVKKMKWDACEELKILQKRKIIRDPAMDSSANFYKRMLQKRNWLAQKRKQLKYPDFSMKDAPVPPRLPVPRCVCGEPAEIIQSTHPDTAARAYYRCGHYMPEMRCHFFQWIDGPEMYDRAFIQQEYMLNYSVRAENFSRWKPYVPDEEAPEDPSKLPSVIHIDDKGKAHANDMDDFDTPARRGHSRNKGKGKAHEAEPGRHSVSGRPGVIRIHDDMDDFDTPARRGQSRDKGKGKAHAAEPGRHSVSGRPGAIYMDDGTDDFDIPARRGESGDKGKAPSTETHRRRDKAPLLWRRGDK